MKLIMNKLFLYIGFAVVGTGVASFAIAEEENRNAIYASVSEMAVLLPERSLGLVSFPDEAITAMPGGEEKVRLLLTAADSSYIVSGDSMEELNRSAFIFGPGDSDDWDNGYAGISGAYQDENGDWYGFYHGEDVRDFPSDPISGLYGMYCAVGAVVSKDNGKTWNKLGQVLRSSKDRNYKPYPNSSGHGLGTPGFVLSRDKKYLYAYYTEISDIQQGPERSGGSYIGLARADVSQGAPVPGTWKKYFNGEFSEEGLGGKDTPVINGYSFPKEFKQNYVSVFQAHPVYSEDLDLYLMVFNTTVYGERESKSLDKGGLYWAWSEDAIQWSSPQRLIKDYSLPVIGESLSWEATNSI